MDRPRLLSTMYANHPDDPLPAPSEPVDGSLPATLADVHRLLQQHQETVQRAIESAAAPDQGQHHVAALEHRLHAQEQEIRRLSRTVETLRSALARNAQVLADTQRSLANKLDRRTLP